jgi:5-methylcytosine-specific restriction enzyme A
VGIDVYGDERRAIVFHLAQQEDEEAATLPPSPPATLDRLRQRALEAASRTEERDPREARSLYRQRSAAVREYVLARADGICESCSKLAPFSRPDGTPYLEPHHTRRLSDGGPGLPRWVGAICPNCHRESTTERTARRRIVFWKSIWQN